jgi:hypothetical protein
MLQRLIRWLTRARFRPEPQEREEPTELARAREQHRAASWRADRALRELHRLDQPGRGRH